MSRLVKKSLMVIDPAVHTPELDSFNFISTNSPISCTYHLPAMFGFASFPVDYSQLAGIIILGSAASVYDGLSWQRPLEDFVASAIDSEVPVLGCCYGHQMLAHMFGGQIGYVKESREKLKGVREVRILSNSLWEPGERSVIVTHAEMITKAPAEFNVIAVSSDIAVEGIAHKSKSVYGFQFHPEATAVFLTGHDMLSASTLSSLIDGHQILRRFVHMVPSGL